MRRHVHGSDHSAGTEAADVQAHGKHNRLLQRDGTIGNGEQSKGYGRAVGEHDGDGAAGGHGQAQHTEPAPAPLESDAANEEVTRQSAGKVCEYSRIRLGGLSRLSWELLVNSRLCQTAMSQLSRCERR